MEITWEEAEVAAQERSEWRRSATQCIHLDAGWIKIKVKSAIVPYSRSFRGAGGTGKLDISSIEQVSF